MLDLLVKLNYLLYQRQQQVKNRLLSPFRAIVRVAANKILPRYLGRKWEDCANKCDEEVIVSLTSFPVRIESVWQTITCLLRQTCQPSKIILWLSKEQFGENYTLPQSLESLIGSVFVVRWVEKDLRSHKKHYYVFQEYPESLVLLVDDDIYYPTDMIERIMRAHKESPSAVICQYGYRMSYDSRGVLCPYNTWEKVFENTNDPNLFFGSGGGTLIKPSALYKDVSKQALFTQLTPIADDIWLNAMVRMADIPVIMIKTGHILPVLNRNDVCLATENRGKNINDEQLINVSQYYLANEGIDPFARRQIKHEDSSYI